MAALPLPQTTQIPRALSPAGGCCLVTQSPQGHRQGLAKPGRSQGWKMTSRPPAWTWVGRPDLSCPGCGPASITRSPCPFTTLRQPNLPENPGQPQPITRKARGHRHPRETRTPTTHTYFIYVLALPSGKIYGCFFRKTWPTRLQGTISRLPPHIHTLKEISARERRPHHCSAS